MKRLILLAVVLAVGMSLAGWRGRFDEQFAAASSRWTPAKLNPIAWYKGDGNALDATGNYNGTWNGSEAYATGKIGKCFNISSRNQNVAIASNAAPVVNITVAAWVKYTHGGIGWVASQAIGETWTSPYLNFGLGVRGNSNVIWRVGIYALNTFTRPVSPDRFTHVVGVRGADKAAIYVDGVLIVDANTTAPLLDHPTQRIAIGHLAPQPVNEQFKGQVDDVLIFDRALTPDEIKKLYDESINKNGEAW